MSESVEPREKSLLELISDVWRARRSMMVFGLCGLVCAGIVLAFATPRYKASMLISPASPINGAEISSLLGNDNLFALRYLVQRVGQENSSDFLRFENIYAGPSVAAELLKDQSLYNGISLDKSFRLGMGKKDWSAGALSEYLSEHVDLQPVNGTSLRRLVYLHPNRDFAIYLLSRLHAVTDSLIRENIFEETSERISYLKTAIRETRNPENRKTLTTLLLEQERLRMLVSIDQPYAAAVIEPAASGSKPAWPDPLFLTLSFVLAFAFVGFVVHLVREEKRNALYGRTVSMKKSGWVKEETADQNNRDAGVFSKTADQ